MLELVWIVQIGIMCFHSTFSPLVENELKNRDTEIQ